jgi:hypothetical protein
VRVAEPSQSQSAPVTPRKADLISKLSYATKCLARTRVSLWRLRQQSALQTRSSVKQSCSGACHKIDLLPVTMKNLILSQTNAFSVSPKGMRWTNEDKLIALGLYYKSPSAYRFMRHTIRLPSESTLKSYISGFNVKTGFDSDYLLALKKRAEGLNDSEKFVVLTFAGMSLR